MSTPEPLDLGHGVVVEFTSWGPYQKAGLVESHLTPAGEPCSGAVLFDLPGIQAAFPGRPTWTLNDLDPLDLSPSLLCRRCGHHGWIKGGRWEPS